MKHRLRLHSPIGRYPKQSLRLGGSRLLIREEIVISAVPIDPPEFHGLGIENLSEIENLTMEEIKFFAAITISFRPSDGAVCLYPLPLFRIEDGACSDDDWAFKESAEFLTQVSQSDHFVSGSVLPPLFGGPTYDFHHAPFDLATAEKAHEKISTTDHLLIRGLGALLKSKMLWVRPEFYEPALLELYIALDASFQIIIRILRSQGLENPTADDAGRFLDEIFGNKTSSGAYFSDYYADRIITIHPQSRFGIFPFPPLLADDFLILLCDLVEIFLYLAWEKSGPWKTGKCGY